MQLAVLPANDVNRAIQDMERIAKIDAEHQERQQKAFNLKQQEILERQQKALIIQQQELQLEYQREYIGLEIERLRSAREAERQRTREEHSIRTDLGHRRGNNRTKEPTGETFLEQMKKTRRLRGKSYSSVGRAFHRDPEKVIGSHAKCPFGTQPPRGNARQSVSGCTADCWRGRLTSRSTA